MDVAREAERVMSLANVYDKMALGQFSQGNIFCVCPFTE